MLRRIDLIAAQNEEYGERFRRLGAAAESVHVTGSIKFDGAETDRDNPATQRLAALAGIQPDDIVFLAGSTQEPEESLALEAFHCVLALAIRGCGSSSRPGIRNDSTKWPCCSISRATPGGGGAS